MVFSIFFLAIIAVSAVSAVDFNDSQVTDDYSVAIESSDDNVEQVEESTMQSEDESFDISQDSNSISESDSNNLLKASLDDEIVGAYDSNGIYYDDNPSVSSIILNTKDSYEVGDNVTLKLGSELSQYDYGSTSIVYVRLDGEQDRSKWVNVGTYGTLKTTGVEYTLTESGSHAIQLILNSYSNYFFSKATDKIVVNGAKTPTVIALTGNGGTEVKINAGESVRFVNTVTPSVPSSRVRLLFNGVDTGMNAFYTNTYLVKYFYDEGTYLVTVFYPGDDNYKNATSNVVKVVVGTPKSSLTANDLSMTYKDGSAWEVTLTDDEGNAVSNSIVEMGIKGKVYKVKTDADGVAKLPINLMPGTYGVNATFNGNENIQGSFVNSTVTVNKGEATLSASDLEMTYKDGSAWTVSLTDAKGNAISGSNVAFGINGKTYNIKTDAMGVAKLTINLMSGTYEVNASFSNSLYDAEIVKASITVNKAVAALSASDLVMSYKDGGAWAVTLTNDKGKVLSGVIVTFKIKSATYNIKTDENGVAKLPINLIIGKYDITASVDNPNYVVDAIANTVTVTDYNAGITANDINMTYKDGTSYDVQVVDGKGNNISVAYLVVKITIKGTSYNVKTDANGIAKLPINLAPGTYDISAEYNGKEITNTVVVNKA